MVSPALFFATSTVFVLQTLAANPVYDPTTKNMTWHDTKWNDQQMLVFMPSHFCSLHPLNEIVRVSFVYKCIAAGPRHGSDGFLNQQCKKSFDDLHATVLQSLQIPIMGELFSGALAFDGGILGKFGLSTDQEVILFLIYNYEANHACDKYK
ncbi:hypothetical protein ABG067_001260 [Albugo candida]|uniref:Uncharacterized protein n=1 Tax=Albugo candida TaxID=65357 RepID=A0A024GT39_9STRA|nr:unnamed protein product [Albugo candida]|eukprot:CCI50112.1 unnamed protein product [Albugo candida]